VCGRIRRRIKGAHLNRIGLQHGQRRRDLVQPLPHDDPAGLCDRGTAALDTAEPLLRDGYEGLVRNASVAQDQEDVADAGELVIQAYTQWGKQPAATAEWKQRVAADHIRLATLKP
jgi:hypothetical protein